jgi:hypothetical protein
LFYWDEDLHLYGWGEAKTWLETHKQATAINLYELLKKPPAPVTLTNIRIEQWGDILIFDGIYEPENEASTFSLIFSGCDIQSWRNNFNKSQLQNPAELIGLQDSIHLAGYHLPASVDTKLFRIHFYYKSLELSGV